MRLRIIITDLFFVDFLFLKEEEIDFFRDFENKEGYRSFDREFVNKFSRDYCFLFRSYGKSD